MYGSPYQNIYQVLDLKNEAADSYQEFDVFEKEFAFEEYQIYHSEEVETQILSPVRPSGCCAVGRLVKADVMQNEFKRSLFEVKSIQRGILGDGASKERDKEKGRFDQEAPLELLLTRQGGIGEMSELQ